MPKIAAGVRPEFPPLVGIYCAGSQKWGIGVIFRTRQDIEENIEIIPMNKIIYKGAEAWEVLQKLDYCLNTFKEFFKTHTLYHQPFWGNGENLEEVTFCWLIHRDYKPERKDFQGRGEFWEMCVQPPPNENFTDSYRRYRPSLFIWNDSYGIREILIGEKVK